MSRALRRHHRARVIAHRFEIASAYYGAWRKMDGAADWLAERRRGELADTQAWIGCGKPRCFVCHPDKLLHRTADRMRAEREWRREWGV